MKTIIKNQKTYVLQKFGATEDENFKVLAKMLYHMPSLKGKTFFKQLGVFFGGLYTIALNREKLKWFKGVLEKFKSSDKGVQGFKKHVEKFLKIPVKTKDSVNALIFLIKYVAKEVRRSRSKLHSLGVGQFQNILDSITGNIGYSSFEELMEKESDTMDSRRSSSYWKEHFANGFNPFYYDPKEQCYNSFLETFDYKKDFRGNWLEMSKVVRDQILKSQRNPELKVYSLEKIENKSGGKNVDDQRKMYEDVEVRENLNIEDVKTLFSDLLGLGFKTEKVRPIDVFRRFGEGLGELYAVCEQSRGLLSSLFSNSSKGAGGAVEHIQEFLKSPGGTEKCAKCLDDLMGFLLGKNGCDKSSSRLAELKEVLPNAWIKLKELTVQYSNLDKFIKSHNKEYTSADWAVHSVVNGWRRTQRTKNIGRGLVRIYKKVLKEKWITNFT